MKTCPLCGRRTALPLPPHIKECSALALAAERRKALEDFIHRAKARGHSCGAIQIAEELIQQISGVVT